MKEILFKELLKPITSIVSKHFNDKLQEKEYIDNMYNLLLSNYKSRINIKNMLHISNPVSFKNIYCPLSIRRLSTNNYTEDNNAISVNSTKSLMESINNLAIFGNAGSGKSTLVNFLYLNSIEEQYKYPIFISLRYLNEASQGVIETLKQQTLGYKTIEKSDMIFSSLLQKGHFLFIFDGYDEIQPDKQYNISNQIKELISQYPTNKYILTSRPMENLYGLDSFYNFTIAPLTLEERKLFIRKQFSSDNQHIANIIINKLSEKKNIQYHQLLNTPLLIILCILNFQYNRDLPPKKSEFYGRVFDALYQGHDWRSKTGFERTRRCRLTKEDYLSILEIFSFYTHFKSIFLFSKECIFEVFKKIRDHEKRNRLIKNTTDTNLLDDLTVAINILIIDGNYYSFPHKSFQEYFCANYIINKTENERKHIYAKFIDNFCNGYANQLTFPLLSILYEKDEIVFIDNFILPLLNNLQRIIRKELFYISVDSQKITFILSMINEIIYGFDEYVYNRGSFTLGNMENHLYEIEKITSYLDNLLKERKDENDFFINEI